VSHQQPVKAPVYIILMMLYSYTWWQTAIIPALGGEGRDRRFMGPGLAWAIQ
jgi:hypothetical protein